MFNCPFCSNAWRLCHSHKISDMCIIKKETSIKTYMNCGLKANKWVMARKKKGKYKLFIPKILRQHMYTYHLLSELVDMYITWKYSSSPNIHNNCDICIVFKNLIWCLTPLSVPQGQRCCCIVKMCLLTTQCVMLFCCKCNELPPTPNKLYGFCGHKHHKRRNELPFLLENLQWMWKQFFCDCMINKQRRKCDITVTLLPTVLYAVFHAGLEGNRNHNETQFSSTEAQ